MKLVGREAEQKTLKGLLDSNKPEFLAIYGRRRIGKTFLIREFFQNKKIIFFNSTGSKDGLLPEQIEHFTEEIGKAFYNGIRIEQPKTWDKTFAILTKAIENAPKDKKIVLFFDELPWMATRNSKLLTALDYYWNQHWSRNDRIKLIICGSAASWIVDKVINNRGGLHNRITKQICLQPFNLAETKHFLNKNSIKLTNTQITQLYMVTGGVPYYLNHVQKGLSATQNIDAMAFAKGGVLNREFDNLFASLFDMHELSVEMITAIAEKMSGISQEAILKKVYGTSASASNIKGKLGLQKLKELEDAGFIIRLKPYLHNKKGIYYKIIDEYVLFYLNWIKPQSESDLARKASSAGYFESEQNSPRWNSWAGTAFESICYKHIDQIRRALHLDVRAIPSTWRFAGKSDQSGAQIDLLFDRPDDSITLCEIKFTNKPFNIDKAYAQNLENKIQVFKNVTRTKKQIFLSIISASGIRKSKYSDELVDQVVVLEDLF